MHADHLHGILGRRGHHGVRVAVSQGKHVHAVGAGEGQAGILILAQRSGRLEGAVVVHADQLNAVVAVRGHHGVRRAVPQPEHIHELGMAERVKVRTAGNAVVARKVPALEVAAVVHAEHLHGMGAARSRDDVRVAAGQGKGIKAVDAGQCGSGRAGFKEASQGAQDGAHRGRRRREGRVNYNILRCGKRAVVPVARQPRHHIAPVCVPNGPAVELQGPRAGIVQVVRAVSLPYHILEDKRSRAVARGVRGRSGGGSARAQLERRRSSAGALVDGDGPAEVDRDRHDCARVRDRMRAVHVVVRRRDGRDGAADPVDRDILQLAERASRPRRRQVAAGPRIQVVCDRAAPERGPAVAVVVKGRGGLPVLHLVLERQRRRAAARHVSGVSARAHPERGRVAGIDVHPCVEHDADADRLAAEVRAVGIGGRDVPHGRRRHVDPEQVHRVHVARGRGGHVRAVVGQGKGGYVSVSKPTSRYLVAPSRVARLERVVLVHADQLDARLEVVVGRRLRRGRRAGGHHGVGVAV